MTGQVEGLVPVEHIERKIYLVHGHRVMLDRDLAAIYGVPTKALNQAVKRNNARFPGDFMLRLTAEEATALRSQIVTLDAGRGRHRKYLPYVFTELGLSTKKCLKLGTGWLIIAVQPLSLRGKGAKPSGNGWLLHFE